MKAIRAHWQIALAVIIVLTSATLLVKQQAGQSCKVDTAAVKEGRLPAATIERCS